MTRIENNLAIQQWLSSSAGAAGQAAWNPHAPKLPEHLAGHAIRFGLDRVLQARPSSLALPAAKGQIHQTVENALERFNEGPGDLAACCTEAVDQVLAGRGGIGEQARADLLKIVQSTASLVVRRGGQLAKEGMGIEKAAKDFEGLFFNQLIESMRKTIDEEGLLEGDGTGKQMRDLYWMFLGAEAGRSGSLGMWKQMAAEMSEHGNLSSATTDFEV
ncbi:MAG: hypothetical protein ACLFUJ_10750 [Phycisphaerae bacterium]